MPFSANCPHCKSPLQIPDASLGQVMHCPRCNHPMRVGAPVAAPPPSRQPAPPAPPPAPAQIKAAPPKKPAPAPLKRPERTAVPAAKDIEEKRAETVSLDGQDAPDNMQPAARSAAQGSTALPSSEEALRKSRLSRRQQRKVLDELGRGEVVVWAGGPDPKIVVVRNLFVPVAVSAAGVVAGLMLLRNLDDFMKDVMTIAGWAVLGGGLLAGALTPLYFAWRARRSYYILTSQRALVWECNRFGLMQFTEYLPDQLARMRREDSKLFGDGAGDLVFRSKTIITHYSGGRDSLGRMVGPEKTRETINYGFVAIRHAAEVERLVRQHLINPYIEKQKRRGVGCVRKASGASNGPGLPGERGQ